MSAIQMLSTQPWVERLGWTLLDFLWQGVLLSGVYAVVRRHMAGSRAEARYLAACVTLAVMVMVPITTFVVLGRGAEPALPRDATARVLYSPPQPGGASVFVPAFRNGERPATWISDAAPWVVAIWLLGAAVCWLRLAGAWWAASRIRSRQVRPASPEWQQALTELGARIRLSRPVRLLVSARVDVPMVVGWLRPVVLVPLGALSCLAPEQIEAILFHELAHIVRRDYLVNVLQGVAEALLFYHPAVWWVSGHIRAERELCCDDMAVAATGDAFVYATALAGLEGYRPVHTLRAVASNQGKLMDRIARLLGQTRPEGRGISNAGAAAGAVLVAVSSCVVVAQPAERPQFEVASVKLTQTQARTSSGMRALPGGRLHAENVTLDMLIEQAYHVQSYQILGGPGWIRDAGIDIEAKGDANANRADLTMMLQPLLEDRFQLKFHRETRELPVYALTAARGGSKLTAPKAGACVQGGGPAAPGGSLPVPCGSVGIMMVPSGMRMRGGDVPMAELIRTLAKVLGRPVLDQTGVTTRFDTDLTFKSDDTVGGLMMSYGSVAGHREALMEAAASASSDANAPASILVAIQEQLGLRLNATKGPVEVLVVDRAEKPSGN